MDIKRFIFDNFSEQTIKHSHKSSNFIENLQKISDIIDNHHEQQLQHEDTKEQPKDEKSKPVKDITPNLYTEEQMIAAKDSAFNEGYQAGLNSGLSEARQEIQAHLLETEKFTQVILQQIFSDIESIVSKDNSINTKIEKDLVKLSMAIVQKIISAKGSEMISEKVIELVCKAINLAKQIPILRIEVHPMIIEDLNKKIATNINSGIKLEIIENASLEPGIANINWQDGGINIDVTNILKQIENLV